MKLEDDVRLTGGSKNMASGEHQTRAQELKNQMAQLTQENVIYLLIIETKMIRKANSMNIVLLFIQNNS